MKAVPSLEVQVADLIRRPHPVFCGPQTARRGRIDSCPDCMTRGTKPFASIKDDDGAHIDGYWCHVCNGLWLTAWGG